MAKTPAKTRRTGSGLLTRLLLLVLLIGIGWQLFSLRDQVEDARTNMEVLSVRVDARRQENAALAADIAEGSTPEKMEEIAREELGLVTQDEYVFYDVSN